MRGRQILPKAARSPNVLQMTAVEHSEHISGLGADRQIRAKTARSPNVLQMVTL